MLDDRYNPVNFTKRHDLWDSPGVEPFNYCYIFNVSLDMWLMNLVTESNIHAKVQERFESYGVMGEDFVITGMHKNVVDLIGTYVWHLTIYSVSDDWEVIDKLKYGPSLLLSSHLLAKISVSLSECRLAA